MTRTILAAIAALALPLGAVASPHMDLPGGETVPDQSIYLLEGKLVDHDGKEVALDLFRGHPVLISMFYATCPHACPMLLNDMKRIERALSEEQRKDLRVVLVTFDPDRDTPEKMKALAEAHKVDLARWKMMTTDKEHIAEIAAVLGIKYRFAKGGAIHHSSIVTLLDREGVPVERLDGLRQPEGPIVERVGKLSRK
jgi:protein SCO1/2